MGKFISKIKEKASAVISKIKLDVTSNELTTEDRKKILQMVRSDVEHAEKVQKEYITQKELDLKHYNMEKPSILEGLTKKKWMSDRNLGLARAIADSFIATYLATCWNPDSINFIATKTNDIDNRNNQEKFTKWGMGKQEANVYPEISDFIHNRVVVGSSFFKIYRKVWEEWIDKRIPVKNKQGNTYKYNIKTEEERFEKGLIENIPDIDDILMPDYGKNIQELPYFVHILHLDGETVLDYKDRKVFKPADSEGYEKKLYNHAYNNKKRTLGEEKLNQVGIDSGVESDVDVRRLGIDIYEWHGLYNKNGKNEKYRSHVDLVNEEVLSLKPLRKINRSGKLPFVGGALFRQPGQMRGVSLMQIIAPIINAFNNVFNQKSDFQYVTNCPFGFHNPNEGYTKQVFELEPMVSFPVGGKPSDSVYFPNLSRSMAWAESDMRILLEVLERLTGAASYFQSRGNQNKTLGQDVMVQQNSETRFGIGVGNIMGDIVEAISMWFDLYQDFPPDNLAERIVGEDGKKLFPNLSIDSLRGDTNVQMMPDTVAGSKAYRKQLQLWAFGVGQQTMWLNPQVNPLGNYNLTADTFKEILNLSDNEVKRYLGEQPKSKFDESELDNEWYKFMNGEDFDPPEGETMLAQQHMIGHMKQKEEKYHLLDEEYRPHFNAHLFKTIVNYMKFIKNAQQQQVSDQIAMRAIAQNPNPPQGMEGQGQPQQNQASNQASNQAPNRVPNQAPMSQQPPINPNQGGVNV